MASNQLFKKSSAHMNIKVSETALPEVSTITLDNGFMKVVLTNFGATICGIYLPGQMERPVNVVLGYDNLEDYFSDIYYVGGTVGRVAGRISNSCFTLNGHVYTLEPNSGSTGHHLHGGRNGFNKQFFTIHRFHSLINGGEVEFLYTSRDGEEGYPGNLEVSIVYSLYADNTLRITYKAQTDQPTHVNLTNHCYFNLTGDKSRALEQRLLINAPTILETDGDYIPTGNFKMTEGTPFDFKRAHSINLYKSKVSMPGYNECYLLDPSSDKAAVLFDPESGRKMELSTSYPSLIFYTGDYLEGIFQRSQGICLEPQYLPDAPNHPSFGGTTLLAGQIYNEFIDYVFSV